MELEVRQFRWHEQAHGIPRNMWGAIFDDTSNSIEFNGTRSASFRWNEQFHGT